MAHLCVPQNQALGVCRGLFPDIQVCSTDGREDLVNATITSNAEKEEEPSHKRTTHLVLVLHFELGLDVESPQGDIEVPLGQPEAVSDGTQEIGGIVLVHVELPVGVHVLPRQVLHVDL